jgi:predicted AAA+ superfamily ATPase
MFSRTYWLECIEAAWRRRPVIWLSGVRRAGKTQLCLALPASEYFDCELPSVRRRLADPELFLRDMAGRRVVLDEIHRLPDPSELLKIAADHFPGTRVLATGSSTLGASSRFGDTLTGRKENLWLTPMMSADVTAFGGTLEQRLQRGGLPPFFVAGEAVERDYQEWLDAYWARDIQELFRLEKRHTFQKFLELLLVQSGGMYEATRFARECEASRPTMNNYLAVLEATHVVHVLRPFSHRRAAEIVAAPKVYGFDTGFVCMWRGWRTLRPEDHGVLWEHYVLNELHARLQNREIRYWRDKQGHEVDFVIERRGAPPLAIECKWRYRGDSFPGLEVFARHYPEADLLVVAADAEGGRTIRCGAGDARLLSLEALMGTLMGDPIGAGGAVAAD